MIGTSALKVGIPSAPSSTFLWEKEFFRPKINASVNLLPEVGNYSSSPISSLPATISTTAIKTKAHTENNFTEFVSFKSLESWVGCVSEVGGNLFTATVISDKHPGTRESAEFSFDEISEDDRGLVHEGAIFYWSVGYQVNEFGGRFTASILRFQRLRHWSRKELELAKARSDTYSDWFLGSANGPIDTSK